MLRRDGLTEWYSRLNCLSAETSVVTSQSLNPTQATSPSLNCLSAETSVVTPAGAKVKRADRVGLNCLSAETSVVTKGELQ